MIFYYIISGITFFLLFVFFLVISKTLNGIINQLLKLEYILQKELEFGKEEREVKRLLEENEDYNEKNDEQNEEDKPESE